MIKKSTLFFILLLFVNFLQGQTKKAANLETEKVVRNTLKISDNEIKQRSLVTDTIIPPIFIDDCSLNLFSFLNNTGWGAVGGMNAFGDLEKAQRFYYIENNFQVLDVSIFFADVFPVGDGEIRAKVYEVDTTTSGPGVLVGTSEPVKVSALQIDPSAAVPTQFTFTTPADITSNQFFVSVDFSAAYATNDTVSLLMTDIDCGIARDSWELFSDGQTWEDMSDTTSWNIITNFLMLATVQTDGVSSTKELISNTGNIRLLDAFPNPTTEFLNVQYELEKSADISVEIYSLQGKLLQQINKNNQAAGNYQEQISIRNLPAGNYLYGIRTNQGRLMNKFTVF